jgi:hypothetical protein
MSLQRFTKMKLIFLTRTATVVGVRVFIVRAFKEFVHLPLELFVVDGLLVTNCASQLGRIRSLSNVVHPPSSPVTELRWRLAARGWLACNARAALLVAEQFVPMAWALPARLA